MFALDTKKLRLGIAAAAPGPLQTAPSSPAVDFADDQRFFLHRHRFVGQFATSICDAAPDYACYDSGSCGDECFVVRRHIVNPSGLPCDPSHLNMRLARPHGPNKLETGPH
jgi:hypothetical protein